MVVDRQSPIPVARREPVLYFHTSNTEKFVQARLLASTEGVRLSQFVAGSEPYDEDYALAPQDMLATALRQAVRAAGRSSLVFVEDTTVRIDALSSDSRDVPGLRTKEWFQETSFQELDEQLRGDDVRRAAVRSDIALSIPGLADPVFFSGETCGHVVKAQPADRTHPLYTWLTTRTFNGWFVPDGAQMTLGEMEYEESLKYDFRAKSLKALFDRVHEYSAILSVPPKAYRRPLAIASRTPDPIQPSLFGASDDRFRSPLIVLGESCAGKTTMARGSIARSGAIHLEASEFLVPLASTTKIALPDRNTHPAEFASVLLSAVGFDAVAKAMLDSHEEILRSEDSIITGFRTIEELRLILRAFPDSSVVHVSAPFNMRFERFSIRKREATAGALTPSEFRDRDREQQEFGLLPVARELCDIQIDNLLSEGEYLRTVLTVWDAHVMRSMRTGSDTDERRTRSHDPLSRPVTRLSRCLELLRRNGPMTLPALERDLGLGDHNASRILGFSPRTTAREEPSDGGRTLWRITDAGEAYLELIGRRIAPD